MAPAFASVAPFFKTLSRLLIQRILPSRVFDVVHQFAHRGRAECSACTRELEFAAP